MRIEASFAISSIEFFVDSGPEFSGILSFGRCTPRYQCFCLLQHDRLEVTLSVGALALLLSFWGVIADSEPMS